jgi:hypothetical protein
MKVGEVWREAEGLCERKGNASSTVLFNGEGPVGRESRGGGPFRIEHMGMVHIEEASVAPIAPWGDQAAEDHMGLQVRGRSEPPPWVGMWEACAAVLARLPLRASRIP